MTRRILIYNEGRKRWDEQRQWHEQKPKSVKLIDEPVSHGLHLLECRTKLRHGLESPGHDKFPTLVFMSLKSFSLAGFGRAKVSFVLRAQSCIAI